MSSAQRGARESSAGSAGSRAPGGPPADSLSVAALFRAHWSLLLFGIASVALLVWFGHNLFDLHLGANATRSDYWEHTAAIRALMTDPVHPGNPHLATEDPSPRYTPEFVALSLVGGALGMTAWGVMALAGTLNVALLVAGIYAFFRLYFRDERAPLYGLIVMLCSWYHGFSYSNVYQLRLLFQVAGYPSTGAVALTLLTFAVAILALRHPRPRWWLVLLLLSTANVILTHALTATMTVTGVVAMAWFAPETTWRRRGLVMGAALAACFLVEAWPYFSTWRMLATGDEVDLSWIGGGLKVEDAGTKDLAFYELFPLVRTVGFALLGIGPLVFFVISGRHLWLVAGAVAMFLPFAVNPSVELPLGHRFILLVIPFLQIGLVWSLLKATPGYHEGWWRLLGGRWRRWVAVGGVVLTLAVMVDANLGKAVRAANVSRRGVRDNTTLCRAVSEATGPEAIVLTDETTGWPLPTCGTKIVSLLHPNPFVADHRVRLAAVAEFLRPKAKSTARERVLEHYGVTHVLLSKQDFKAVHRFLRKRAVQQTLPNKYVLYTLRK